VLIFVASTKHLPMPQTDSPAQSNSDSTIQVAKITSRQAIIVALITSLAGVLGDSSAIFQRRT